MNLQSNPYVQNTYNKIMATGHQARFLCKIQFDGTVWLAGNTKHGKGDPTCENSVPRC